MRTISLAAMAIALGAVSVADAQPGRSYPLVYGPAGRPYGPTQAEYQYQRQYGRPWHGYGGVTYSGSHGVLTSGGYGYGYGYWAPVLPPAGAVYGYDAYGYLGGYGLGGYGVVYGGPYAAFPAPYYMPMPAPTAVVPAPAWSPSQMSNPLADAVQQNSLQWGDQLPVIKPNPITRPPTPSTTDGKLKSLEAQANGDQDLRNQKWLQAYVDYKKAVQLADDRADARLRLGLSLIALQHYDSAAFELKRAIQIDPTLPQSGLSLAELFGPGSELARGAIAHRLLDYVQADIRDPDRLFLMGVLLHFDGNPNAREVLETGMRLSNGGRHFAAFLQPTLSSPPASTDDTYVPKSSTPKPATSPTPATPPTTVPMPPAPALPPAPLPEQPSVESLPRLTIPNE